MNQKAKRKTGDVQAGGDTQMNKIREGLVKQDVETKNERLTIAGRE